MKKSTQTGALALAVTMLFALPALAGIDAEDYELRLEAESDRVEEFQLLDVEVIIDFPDGNELQGYQWGVCNDEFLTLGDDGDIVNGSGIIDLGFTFESRSLVDGDDDGELDDGWTVGALFNVITGDTLEPGEDLQIYVCTYTSNELDDGVESVESVIEFCDTLGSPAVNTQLIVFDSVELVPTLASATVEVGPPPAPELSFKAPVEELSADEITVSVLLDNPEPEKGSDAVEVYAFSFGLTYDDSFVGLESVEQGSALDDFNDGTGPSYFAAVLDPDGAAGLTVACVVSFGPNDFEFLGTGLDQEVASVTYSAVIGAPENSVADLQFVDDLGSPTVTTTLSVQGAESVVPEKIDGSITITIPEVPVFLRGDANGDGIIDISDPFFLARALFVDGAEELACDDAGDADDNESLGILDASEILAYLFTGGDDLPAPFPDCGPGTEGEGDALLCETSQVDTCL